MSPEQVSNEAMDRRSDVFSLAIVLWEMLTGEPLFTGDSLYAVAFAVGQQEIKPPSQVRGEPLPHGLDAAVLNALDRDLARRTPSAAQFAEELEQVVQASGGESLESWAERELKVSREQHTTWLAGIAAGTPQLPKLAGRSSAQVTELGGEPKLASGPEEAADGASAGTSERGDLAPVNTSIGGTSLGPLDAAAPRRKLGPIVAVLLLLLAGGGIAVYFATRTHEAAPVAKDAALPPPADAAPRPIPVAVDAPVVIEVDAAIEVPIDAGRHHAPPVDAGRKPDAAVAIDAPPAPTGTGYLIAKNKSGGTYLNVIVDGKQLGVTPILGKGKPLPAGKHHVQLVRPDTGDVVVDQTLTIDADQKAEVVEH
jgi:serine/threonine-protein kinase